MAKYAAAIIAAALEDWKIGREDWNDESGNNSSAIIA